MPICGRSFIDTKKDQRAIAHAVHAEKLPCYMFITSCLNALNYGRGPGGRPHTLQGNETSIAEGGRVSRIDRQNEMLDFLKIL